MFLWYAVVLTLVVRVVADMLVWSLSLSSDNVLFREAVPVSVATAVLRYDYIIAVML